MKVKYCLCKEVWHNDKGREMIRVHMVYVLGKTNFCKIVQKLQYMQKGNFALPK